MAAIIFPTSPTLNQEFTAGDRTWVWDGTVWDAVDAVIAGPTGFTASGTAPTDTSLLWADTASAATNVLPANGSKGQVLTKLTDTSFDTTWTTPVGSGNVILNADFAINQRGFTSTTVNGEYSFDRWTNGLTTGGGTVTFSAQTFALGTAPVAGYEGTNFYRCVTSGQTGTDSRALFRQNIESVKTFAGSTVTVSFFAKAATGSPSMNVELRQLFGSSGSAEVNVVSIKQAVSTSWARYSFTLSLPSIAGKTINGTDALRLQIWASAGSVNDAVSGTLGIQNNTFDIWGIQLEEGSVATPFRRNASSLQAELAACQRYYYRHNQTVPYERFAFGSAVNTNSVSAMMQLKQTLRASPTSIEYNGLTAYDQITQSSAATSATITVASPQSPEFNIGGVGAGLTQYRPYQIIAAGTSGSYIAFSAEL